MHYRVSLLLITAALVSTTSAIELRVMSFNASLNRPTAGGLATELADPTSIAPRRIAEIIQHIAPDVLLINEFDHNAEDDVLRLFQDNFLATSQNGQPPITYPYRYAPPTNTGLNSNLDLDNAGGSGRLPGDAFGFGQFHGQFNQALFSKHPIDTANIRTFQNFLWKNMPGNVLPPTFYSQEELDAFRLSSKNHCDVPVTIGPTTVHFLISHPTPPAFDDGQEDRNKRRNTDEIRLWADYIDPAKSNYLIDDSGKAGGLPKGTRFVIMGDQNADPDEGSSRSPAILQLLENPLINTSITPTSPRVRDRDSDDTATFNGGLRVDYCLPSTSGLTLNSARVIWPVRITEPLFDLLGGSTNRTTSDHRPIVIELTVEPLISTAVPDLKIGLQQNSLTLNWSAQPQIAYIIEQSPTLAPGAWTDEGAPTVTITEEGGAEARATPLPEPAGFFRVRAAFE